MWELNLSINRQAGQLAKCVRTVERREGRGKTGRGRGKAAGIGT